MEKMKISAWRVIISAALFAIVAQVIHTLGSFATMGFYTDPKYASVWSKVMMPTVGPPPASFFGYSILFGLITALLFVMIYIHIGSKMHGKTAAKRGLSYGLMVFLVGTLPGMFMLYLLINLPAMLIVEWAVEMLAINLLGGMIVAKINK
jgi:hypothetical protein